MARVLISGYYGCGNLGDEAVLGGLLAGLRAQCPDAEPVVLSAQPADTTALHGVPALPRMRLGVVRQALREARLFVSGGGSLLQDVTSLRSLAYYLGLFWLAAREGTPTVMIGQGVGPLRNPLGRLFTRRALQGFAAITVRDAGSATLLRQIGVANPPPEVTADLAFLLDPEDTPRLQAWWASHLPADRPVIGVALRRWQTRDAAKRFTAISDALAALAHETGAFLLFLPMHGAGDLGVADEVAGWTPAESRVLDLALTPREMLALVGRCDAIAAMRLHTLIFAVHRGVPALGLAYDPKVADFTRAAGLPPALPWAQVARAPLLDALLQVWETRVEIRARLDVARERLTRLARRNIEVICTELARAETASQPRTREIDADGE